MEPYAKDVAARPAFGRKPTKPYASANTSTRSGNVGVLSKYPGRRPDATLANLKAASQTEPSRRSTRTNNHLTQTQQIKASTSVDQVTTTFGFQRTTHFNPHRTNREPLSKTPDDALRSERTVAGLSTTPQSAPENNGNARISTLPRQLRQRSGSRTVQVFGNEHPRLRCDDPINTHGSTTISGIIPELDRYRPFPADELRDRPPHQINTDNLPPPTPVNSAWSGQSYYSGYSGLTYGGMSGYSVSPSTRFSESPGPGAYSRDTTPTSMSSQSPGLVVPLRTTPRLRQGSPVISRPPLSAQGRMGSVALELEENRVDAQGLPSLRESMTSSSSNSTVKDVGRPDGKSTNRQAKRLSPLPPSPPPRMSSQKSKTAEDRRVVSPMKTLPSSAKSMPSSIPSNVAATEESRGEALQGRLNKESVTAPPSRPSRKNTPDLQAQLFEAPAIVQSNLSKINLSPQHRRTSSSSIDVEQIDHKVSPLSRIPARQTDYLRAGQDRRVDIKSSTSGLGIVPRLQPIHTDLPSQQVSGSRTPSPSSTSSRSRFNLFGRRAKTAIETPVLDATERSLRKGPVAGTGHEGYSRQALRGRSGSANGKDRSVTSSLSPSQQSNRSSGQDPFILARMSPVVIAGGGEIVSNRNLSIDLGRTDSRQSTAPRPSIDSKASSIPSTKSSTYGENMRTTMWPSSLPKNTIGSQSSASITSDSTMVSESSQDMDTKFARTAVRRSIQRINSDDSTGTNSLLPRSIKTKQNGTSLRTANFDATSVSDRSQTQSQRGGLNRSTLPPKKLSKRPRSPRKWNFFHRSQPLEREPTGPAIMSVVVAAAPSKSVAHYAMMDFSEQEGNDSPDIEDILREAEVFDVRPPRSSPVSKNFADDKRQEKDVMEMFHSPRTPGGRRIPLRKMSKGQECTVSKDDVVSDVPSTGRPSRLPQVGRIPKVVTARPEQTSPKSFSRPFARLSTIQPTLNADVVDQQSIALGLGPQRSPSPPNIKDPSPEGEVWADSALLDHRQFLVISPRKDSVTTSSSSAAMSLETTTAIVPNLDTELGEDEVWDEYNDLIGGGETAKPPQSATSSHGVPFQFEHYQSGRLRTKAAEHPSVNNTASNSASQGLQSGEKRPPRLALTSSSVYSPDLGAQIKSALSDVPTPPPVTPLSFTDFISGYGDRNNSTNGSSERRRLSSPSARRASKSSPNHSPSPTIVNAHQKSGPPEVVAVSKHKTDPPVSQVNLRVGSMTVSKWLTFGHVLFSPARDTVVSNGDHTKHHSILVIDGLGNDDWSFYAAETYPDATFYNLSPTPARATTTSQTSYMPATPLNHRQVQSLSTSLKFPFPSSYFTAVIVRFPSALIDSAFRNLVAESRRVLKPGGYLELSILDLDMLNMGNRCRRAVRALKVRLAAMDPAPSLAPASDTALRLLAKRGFVDVKSCRVGVPVASVVTRSTVDTSKARETTKTNELSLAEMMRDKTQNGDEGIAQMVAKVGRWWYTRCYEAVDSVGSNSPTSSIFADAKVLDECETWGTSFKLLVCYAQKPVLGRRRTASV